MPNNHYSGSKRPLDASRDSSRGKFGVLKLLFVAGCMLGLAAYIGSRKPATNDAPPASAPAQLMNENADAPSPVVLGPSNPQPGPATVGDASFSVSQDGRTLFVAGSIGKRFFEDFNKALEANRFLQRVVITSGGGYAGSGLEAAQLIRKNNLTVRIKSYCASMCVGLWAAAAAREMEPDAVIGLHQWRPTCDALPEAQRKECEYGVQFLTAHDASYDGWLRSAGFSDRLLKLQETTPAHQVAVFGAPQLWAEGVDFRVVDAEGKYLSREQTTNYLVAKYGRNKHG